MLWAAYGRTPLQLGDYRIVIAVGTQCTVDNEQLPVLVPASHNAHMRILRVKYQVAGLSILPGNRPTVTGLGGGSAAIANHIFDLSLGM